MTQLLEQNYLILSQYKQNMQQYKVNENTGLLVQFKDNILTILNQMSCMTGLMQHMPDLPVRLNEDLANSFLPKASSNLYGTSSQTGLPCKSAASFSALELSPSFCLYCIARSPDLISMMQR